MAYPGSCHADCLFKKKKKIGLLDHPELRNHNLWEVGTQYSFLLLVGLFLKALGTSSVKR